MLFTHNNDIIEIRHKDLSQFAKLIIIQFNTLADNMILVNKVVEYLKKIDIKWVTFIDNNYFSLENIFAYKSNNTLNCHLEDLVKFYYKNLGLILCPNNIYIELVDDGWTKVIDSKKEKILKLKSIKKEISEYVFDWSF